MTSALICLPTMRLTNTLSFTLSQNDLHAHVAYVPEVRSSSQRRESSWFSDGLTSLFKSAARGASSLTESRATAAELSAYADLLHTVCTRAQIVEEWMTACEERIHALSSSSSSSSSSQQQQRRGSQHSEDEMVAQARLTNLLVLLRRATEFLHAAFCAVAVRDMRAAMARYTKHCARALISPV